MNGYQITDSNTTEWRKSTIAEGVEVKDLGKANGREMQLVRFAPGTTFPRHVHGGPEFVFLLEGEAYDQGQRLLPGWAVVAATGTSHDNFNSPSGAYSSLCIRNEIVMSTVWNASAYDTERRRLIPCFDEFYGSASELIVRFCADSPRILDLGAGTGVLSAAISERVPMAQLHLLDASADMLQQAARRLSGRQLQMSVQPLDAELPPGPFDAIVSALAIHHLDDDGKRSLYSRILEVLAPGGIFINAEQVSGNSPRLQNLFESVHLDRARALGSSDAEIAGAIQRMSYDQCAIAEEQVRWLGELGFEDADCFYRSFRFAVFGAWRPTS